jgi:ribosomal protein S18 acetylase RimI-like enzyme
MSHVIQPMPPEKFRGYRLVFTYETAAYYDAVITETADGFAVSFEKKPFEHLVQKEFDATLYPDHWENAEAFGIFDGEKLLACLEIWKEDWSNRLRVTELWVDAACRRQGLGKALMDFAKEKARAKNCRALMLETQSCNEKAIAFYRAQGLVFFGFDRSCYDNQDVEKREVRVELGCFLG